MKGKFICASFHAGRPLRDRDFFFLLRGRPLGDEPLHRRLHPTAVDYSPTAVGWRPTAVSCSSSSISVGALVDPPVRDNFFSALGDVLSHVHLHADSLELSEEAIRRPRCAHCMPLATRQASDVQTGAPLYNATLDSLPEDQWYPPCPLPPFLPTKVTVTAKSQSGRT